MQIDIDCLKDELEYAKQVLISIESRLNQAEEYPTETSDGEIVTKADLQTKKHND